MLTLQHRWSIVRPGRVRSNQHRQNRPPTGQQNGNLHERTKQKAELCGDCVGRRKLRKSTQLEGLHCCFCLRPQRIRQQVLEENRFRGSGFGPKTDKVGCFWNCMMHWCHFLSDILIFCLIGGTKYLAWCRRLVLLHHARMNVGSDENDLSPATCSSWPWCLLQSPAGAWNGAAAFIQPPLTSGHTLCMFVCSFNNVCEWSMMNMKRVELNRC